MKQIIIATIVIVLLVGCSTNSELFKETDALVESLQTTYNSYGAFGSSEHSVTTTDGLYRIMPMGRLINVKIQEYVDDEEYEELRQDLEDHYEGDSRVNDVYICQGGTIMIDCRN